jgi:hypothetical protein
VRDPFVIVAINYRVAGTVNVALATALGTRGLLSVRLAPGVWICSSLEGWSTCRNHFRSSFAMT